MACKVALAPMAYFVLDVDYAIIFWFFEIHVHIVEPRVKTHANYFFI